MQIVRTMGLNWMVAMIVALVVMASPQVSAQTTQPEDVKVAEVAEVAEEESPAVEATSEFPESWFMIDPITSVRYFGWQDIEGYASPRFKIEGWVDNPIELDELHGNVVVVNFWSLECGPCVLQFKKNVDLANKLKNKGVIWLSIHDYSAARTRLPAMVRQFKPTNPVGVDLFNITSRAWNVPVHPFYYVIDRSGEVRAMGLKRGRINDVVKKLLAEPFDPEKKPRKRVIATANQNQQPHIAMIPEAWLEGTDQERRRLANQIEINHPPSPTSSTWINSEPMTLTQLKGKVVMLDFWATWSMPSKQAVETTNALYKQYKEQGLEIIGIGHPRGVEKMAQTVEQWGIEFPVCADTKGTMHETYRVHEWPDYYFIDRQGRLRVIDCRDENIEDVIKALLNEPEHLPETRKGKNNALLSE